MTKTKEIKDAEGNAGCGNEAKSLGKVQLAFKIEKAPAPIIDADSIQAAAEEALGRIH